MSTSFISDTGAEELLSALVAFLHSIVQGHGASPASTNTVDRTGSEVINEVEGKKLLSALTAFVTATVNFTPKVHSKQEDSPRLGTVMDEQSSSGIPPALSKEVAPSELETKTLTAAHAHVFNKMPIRLLAFDKNGSNIQLIERNEIFTRILPSVFVKTAEPEFQSARREAERMTEFHTVITAKQYRQNRMKELLQSAVEQGVHYAILSHTWIRDTPGDIVFHDWATREHNRRGNTKVVKFCEVAARNHGLTLGWMDNVCINKESSSELDESIRSMYNWYRHASVCVTYLSETSNISDAPLDSWFTRGWTLQELLAPVHSVFYNGDWTELGSGNDTEIQSIIRKACGVTNKELELCRRGALAEIPFSRRMQMACNRHVTREEDTSYSLMGILGVDMSIAYGEGASRALFRLVREVFDTKKNVVDLFNRTYNWDEKLFPSSLESYRYRFVKFDLPDGGSSLDHFSPPEPIILTQLGVRIPLLLSPGVVVTSDTAEHKEYIPKGALSGSVPFSRISGVHGERTLLHLLLCDSRLYAGEVANLSATLNSVPLPEGVLPINTIGTINFGVDTTGDILLPERCLGLDLNWSGLQEGHLSPLGNVWIGDGLPFNIILKSTKGFKFFKAQLEEHGMQVVTLYL